MTSRTMQRRVWNGKDYVTATFTVTVDFDKIVDDLARKALYNKSRKAKQVRGAVVVEYVTK